MGDLNMLNFLYTQFAMIYSKKKSGSIKEEKYYVLEGRRLKPQHTGNDTHENRTEILYKTHNYH